MSGPKYARLCKMQEVMIVENMELTICPNLGADRAAAHRQMAAEHQELWRRVVCRGGPLRKVQSRLQVERKLEICVFNFCYYKVILSSPLLFVLFVAGSHGVLTSTVRCLLLVFLSGLLTGGQMYTSLYECRDERWIEGQDGNTTRVLGEDRVHLEVVELNSRCRSSQGAGCLLKSRRIPKNAEIQGC